jgi:hypothetical protein
LCHLELAEEPDLHVLHRTTIAPRADQGPGDAPSTPVWALSALIRFLSARLSGSSVAPQGPGAGCLQNPTHRGKEA